MSNLLQRTLSWLRVQASGYRGSTTPPAVSGNNVLANLASQFIAAVGEQLRNHPALQTEVDAATKHVQEALLWAHMGLQKLAAFESGALAIASQMPPDQATNQAMPQQPRTSDAGLQSPATKAVAAGCVALFVLLLLAPHSLACRHARRGRGGSGCSSGGQAMSYSFSAYGGGCCSGQPFSYMAGGYSFEAEGRTGLVPAGMLPPPQTGTLQPAKPQPPQ